MSKFLTRITVVIFILAINANLALAQSPFRANKDRYRDQGAHPTTGRAGTATMAARALLNKDGTTSVEATAAGTGRFSKMQVKPAKGGTTNFNGLSSGFFSAPFSGLHRNQAVQLQGNIRGVDGKRTDVVALSTSVLRRPDLSVSTPIFPSVILAGAPTLISANVQELNGDVGAFANCVLYVNGAEKDRAPGIWVDAGDSVTCTFSPTFDTPGAKSITIAAEQVSPGDFDPANNVSAARAASVLSLRQAGNSDLYIGIVEEMFTDADITYSIQQNESISGGSFWLDATINGVNESFLVEYWSNSSSSVSFEGRERLRSRTQLGVAVAVLEQEIELGSRIEASLVSAGGTEIFSQVVPNFQADDHFDLELDEMYASALEGVEGSDLPLADLAASLSLGYGGLIGVGGACTGKVALSVANGIAMTVVCNLGPALLDDIELAPGTEPAHFGSVIVGATQKTGTTYVSNGLLRSWGYSQEFSTRHYASGDVFHAFAPQVWDYTVAVNTDSTDPESGMYIPDFGSQGISPIAGDAVRMRITVQSGTELRDIDKTFTTPKFLDFHLHPTGTDLACLSMPEGIDPTSFFNLGGLGNAFSQGVTTGCIAGSYDQEARLGVYLGGPLMAQAMNEAGDGFVDQLAMLNEMFGFNVITVDPTP